MTVPARSPVDAALDRLGGLRATAESLGMAVATQWFADLATVCEALERQRELASHESDEIVHWREQFEAMSFERDAAEAEVRRLTEGLRDIEEVTQDVIADGHVMLPDIFRIQAKARALLSAREKEEETNG